VKIPKSGWISVQLQTLIDQTRFCEGGLIYGNQPNGVQSLDAIDNLRAIGEREPDTVLAEIPSFEAGPIAFLFVFLLMGIMFLILRTERNKTMPGVNQLGPAETATFENPLSLSDTPYVAITTLVVLELILNFLIVASALQGVGSIAIGTMLAIVTFLAAVILVVYRSAFMSDDFTRKPRLEDISARLVEEHD